jgi:hypothetical protein
MAFEGELKGIAGTECVDCGTWLELEVCSSAAGYYLGYMCNCCGPYSRESGYFPSYEAADNALNSEKDMQLRNTRYTGGINNGYRE